MKSTILKAVILIFICLVSLISCELFTEPDTSGSGRAYIWQTDTLTTPFGSISRIWAQENPDAEWATYYGGDLDKAFWQGDNKGNWSYEKKGRSITPLTIFGFAENDIWAAGSEGVIFHYDGSDWQLDTNVNIGTYSRFYDLWGENTNDLYAVGGIGFENDQVGIIYHYDGIKWIRLNIDEYELNFKKILKGDNHKSYFLKGKRIHNYEQELCYLFELNGTELKEIYSGIDGRNDSKCSISLIRGNIYMLIGNTIYEYTANEFSPVVNGTPTSDYTLFLGHSLNSIYFLTESAVIHYNGENYDSLHIINDNISPNYISLTKNRLYVLDWLSSTYQNVIYRGTRIF